jgi:predicted nicotinamide N-methyase
LVSKIELVLHCMEFESKNRSMKEPVGEIEIPVGNRTVKMCVPEAEEEPGTRLSFWWGITTAAVALSRHLHAMGNLSGKRAIELGCGLGLSGVTAALLGAEVTFTDYVPEALAFAEKNALLNGLRRENTRFRPLDWERPEALDGFDLVLGSEILYEYFFHGCLIRLIEQALGPGGTIVLADRKRLVVSRFLGRLRDKGFRVRERVDQIVMQGFPAQKISVFELVRVEWYEGSP